MKLIKLSKVKGFIAKHLCRWRRKHYTPDQLFAPQGYIDFAPSVDSEIPQLKRAPEVGPLKKPQQD